MSNIWLKMTDVMGESQDLGHEGEIDVTSWTLCKTKSDRTSKGKSTRVGYLSFVHNIDLASSSLSNHMFANKVAEQAILTIRKPTAQPMSQGLVGKIVPPIDYQTIILKQVMVMSMDSFGYGGGHFEEVALSFVSIDWRYSPQIKPGIYGGVAQAFYDLGPHVG